MLKYRIRYKNAWHDEVTLIYETTEYEKVYEMAKNNFGKDNILAIEPLDELSSVNKHWYLLTNRDERQDV